MIRRIQAAPEDAPFLYQLYASTRSDEMTAWGWGKEQAEAFLAMQYTFQRRSYEQRFPQAEHSILYHNQERVGQVLIWRGSDQWILADVSLLPECRWRGIGSELIRELQSMAAKAGVPLRLSVQTDNPAVRLYERLHFRVIEQGDVYHRMEWHPEQAVTAGREGVT
ncbi:GNAT family N-acetyltransferase [Paenibacillus sp. CC-CFT747]|nr:GNAT family N-acetyltransferase [Paenibacillus sp. CC-CFT747]